MERMMCFGDVVEAVDRLSAEEQDTLIELVRRRRLEERRQELIEAVEESRREYAAGLCKTGSVDDLMKEILS